MTDQDAALVAELKSEQRFIDGTIPNSNRLCERAAASIEALTAERDRNRLDYDSAMVRHIADAQRRIDAAMQRAEAALAGAQAKIDALMLEYCPDEMTPEQLAEWGKHQVAAPAAPREGA